jgi:hypothetical protein
MNMTSAELAKIMAARGPKVKPRAKRFTGKASEKKRIAMARVAAQALRQSPDVGRVVASLPIRTVNPNNGSHGHWSITAKRREREHNVTRYVLAALVPMPPLPWHVKLTRCGRGTRRMDFDGLVASLKIPRDQIAQCAGVDDGNEKQIVFEYAQRREAAYGVEVIIDHMRTA